MINILLGLIPESIFFSLFIILTKGYKNKFKNMLLVLLMTIGYIVLKSILPANVYCQIIYILYAPFLMWLLYRKQFHISDLFVMGWANIIYIVLTAMLILFFKLFPELYWILYFINRISIFLFLLIFKNKLNKAYKYIIPQWNRNREKPNPIKALTIRNVCLIGLNLSIFIIYCCMLLTSTNI